MKIPYIFPIVATTLFVFLNLYIYKSISARFEIYDKFKKIKPFLIVFCLFLVIFEGMFFTRSVFVGALKDEILYKICVVCVASSFSLFFLCLAYDILNVSAKFAKFSESRRKFIKICVDVTFVIMAFSYLFKGFYNALKTPKINEVDIKIKNLSQDLNLAVVSDIHLGEFLKKDFLQTIVAQINATSHDGVCIVGDMFDLRSHELGDILEPLRELKKPVFFVTGNHEYYRGAKGLIEALEREGVRVLQNESVEFMGINLLGTHDLSGVRFNELEPNFRAALKMADPNKPKILLAHQPKFINLHVKDEVDLCICGHTHGGQIFPFSLLVALDQKYVHGLYNDGAKQIYVSSGAGFWGPPMRIFADAEIALLRLRRE
ncbi:metallophosphoesterase [Campylobacter sp. JMF_08 NE1]|uniref:metallophosphoesterase n=1 Tax=Campylobacter sp. JMF_08 NE1 TaxID=2983821 RepID=UPI0022EA043C|nr:metallophosphoesterase [Campylobacter sp. JMF_08 NE1]MDA3048188.1 metallophosphoesterase [Campylobacter sp. JMF_08 NE1]